MNDDPVMQDSTRSALADRLFDLFRRRVSAKRHPELIAYFDEIFPLLSETEVKQDPASYSLDYERRWYQLDELLQFYGHSFVEVCYLAVLKRPADEVGLVSGIDRLRNGECTRVEYLLELLFSPEGRQQQVEIPGLSHIKYKISRLRRIPVIGRFAALVTRLGRLTRLDYEIARLNAGHQSLSAALSSAETQLVEFVQSRAEFEETLHNTSEAWLLPVATGDSTERSLIASLPVLLGLHGEAFIRGAYLTVLGRSPDAGEVEEALSGLVNGSSSKILALGALCRRQDASVGLQDIPGLASAYRRERLYRIPVIGPCLRLPSVFGALLRLDQILDYNLAAIDDSQRRLSGLEARMAQHYNESVGRWKDEFVIALKREER